MQYQKYGKPLFKITSIILTASQLATITYEKTIISMKKLSAKELCSTLISNVESKHNPQLYFGKIFPIKLIKWDKIYLPPKKVTCNSIKYKW